MEILRFLNKESLQLRQNDPIHSAGKAALSILETDPSSVLSLAHEKLHAFHFNEVPTSWRRLYEEASLWKVVALAEERRKGWADEVIRCLDMALIMTGAPKRRNLINTALASPELSSEPDDDAEPSPSKRRRISPHHESAQNEITSPTIFNTFPQKTDASRLPFVVNPVEKLACPSLQTFQDHAQQKQMPVILTETLEHWPALKTWQSPQHWLDCTLGGRRIVPVELGRSYTDEGWGQKIMPFCDFLQLHLLQTPDQQEDNKDEGKDQIGYLAQHDLLTQIPKIRSEIAIPDYCYIDAPKPATKTSTERSEDEDDDLDSEPLLNIWLGPEGTISPCHTDPHHNILAQVVGRKYVRLFAPSESEKLYPMGGGKGEVDKESEETATDTDNEVSSSDTINMSNTSRVDVSSFLQYGGSSPDLEDRRAMILKECPEFEAAKFVDCVLEPGECLYIPRGWWHFITSMDVSASVSFWWD